MELDLVKDYISNYLNTKAPDLVKRDLQLNAIKGKAITIVGPRKGWKDLFDVARNCKAG
jgi:hypothetical protein